MGDIIPFPGRHKKRGAKAAVDDVVRFRSVRSSPAVSQRATVERAHKSAFELADDIGKAYKFWFLLQSIPDDDQVFHAALQKFEDCLNRIAAERGAQSLRQMGGIYVDLAGSDLAWQRSETGQTILSAPLQTDASDLRHFISSALSSGAHHA